ncbi:MAG: hypothetical protein ILP12_02840 [Lachnospiraceae bacterium]|nr:hypothetical protein [Lachnospiraceae bacterium]
MKKSLYNILSLVAAALALIGLILFIVSNSTAGYSVPGAPWGILCGIVAIAAICGAAYLTQKSGSQSALTAIVKIVALAALMVEIGIILADRSALAANLFTWDGANTVGWSAFGTGAACAGCALVAAIICIVTAFMVEEPAE